MANPTVLYETKADGRIVVITINRPESMNSMSKQLMRELAQAWTNFANDEEAWVAILTGTGDRAFCAGQDLKERASLEEEGGDAPYRERAPNIFPLSETLNLWKPTIAAINGYAVAGGWMLAQQCDIRIAAQHAELGIAEVKWNQGAGWVAPLTRQMHMGHVLEIVLWGDRRVTAQRAYEMGFVNKVVPQENLMDEAMEWAQRMLYLAPRAVRNLKEIVYRGFYMPPLEARSFSAAKEYNLRGMEDSLEGPKAFAEKRQPVFKDR